MGKTGAAAIKILIFFFFIRKKSTLQQFFFIFCNNNDEHNITDLPGQYGQLVNITLFISKNKILYEFENLFKFI